MLLIGFTVRIRWRSETSLFPAHFLFPISLLSLMYTFTIFDSFCSYGAFRRTKPHTHTNSSDSCLCCKSTLCKMSLRRRFETIFSVQSSFIAHSRVQPESVRKLVHMDKDAFPSHNCVLHLFPLRLLQYFHLLVF